MAPQIDGINMQLGRQRRHHLIPAAGMETGRVQQQYYRTISRPPLEVGDTRGTGLKLVL
jgi:hypothetical protein